MLPVRKIAALAGAIAFIATAGTALAATKTYCVTTPAAPPGCSGTNEATLTAALTAADGDSGGSDQIILPAGTQTAISPYVYTGSVPLEIDGQGTSTVVTLIGGISNAAVFEDNATGTTVHSLKIAIPAGSDGTALGLHMSGSADVVSNVTVLDNATKASAGIAFNNGGTVSNSTVQMPPNNTAGNTALVISSGTATVTDSTLTGEAGVAVENHAVASIARCNIQGNSAEALYVGDSTASISDSFLSSTSGSALRVLATAHASTVIASFLTIGPNQSGVGVAAGVSGTFNATISLTDSIIANPLNNSIYTYRTAGTGVPTVTTTSSDYDPTTISTYNGAPYVPSGSDVAAYVDPKFANVGANDYHLLAGSPLLNYDPRALGGFDTPSDLSGFARPANGPQDLGAYQHPPKPTVSASVSNPAHSTIYPGTPLQFAASASEPYPNDTLTYSWKFDDGTTANGQTVNHSFSTPNSHTATVTVTDLWGFSASAQTSVIVTPSPPPAPVVRHLSESHKTFRAANKTATISSKRHHKAPIGTVFSFTIDQSATVYLTFSPGRGHGYAHLLMLHAHRGSNHVAFYGKVQGVMLTPKKYTLIVKATNGYGKTSQPLSLTFKIVR